MGRERRPHSDEPVAHSADVFLEQHGPQPGQCTRRRIVEHIEDGCFVPDGQPDVAGATAAAYGPTFLYGAAAYMMNCFW